MKFSEIETLVGSFGASVAQRNFDGKETLMVLQDKLPKNELGIEAWSKGIFITKHKEFWTIGFGQTENIANLNVSNFKELLISWLKEPNDEILRNYVVT